jgi:predicted nucleotidyltransferase
MSATEVRTKLKEGNFTAAKKMLPKAVLNNYEILKSALKE